MTSRARSRALARLSAPPRDATSTARIEVFVDRQPVQSFLVGTGAFDVTIQNGPGTHEVCVYLAPGGGAPTANLGCRTVTRIS